jgi:predicted DNA binding CopG/RHH family protein
MEKAMSVPKIPKTDSIQELAEFWDKHDLTDFEGQLEEVTEPVFEHEIRVKIHLRTKEIEEVKKIAKSKGVGYDALIQEWVREKIHV